MLLTFLNILATIIGVISLLIVTYGVFVGFIAFLRNEFKRINGTYTLDELAILGGVVIVRTVLSVFLNKEIKELAEEENSKST